MTGRGRLGRRAEAGAAGFTLVELTVALVAGLLVALAIVGLSREATRTFHEEVRSSSAEATLRTAVDRLRADLQRAAYMSTPNIMSDPKIAHAPNDPNNVAHVDPNMHAIVRLAGIHLLQGGSKNIPVSGYQVPALTPDAIEIGGNMTSAEKFEVETVQPAGSCTRLTLSSTSPAMYRITAVGPTAQADELNNIFQPYPGRQFMVRLVDDTGRSQFLATCPGTRTANFASATQPYVDVDTTATPVLTARTTQTLGGVTATPGGRAFVNPVQIVRWEVMAVADEPAQYRSALGSQSLSSGTVDGGKYDLVRSFVDVFDNVVTETTEVVAEYAVDLNFAFSVENGNPAQPAMITLAFDDAVNQNWADDVSTHSPLTNRPERIRIVRARLATRTAQPDRTVNVPVPAFGVQPPGFLYRYCLLKPCATNNGVLRWARARTLTTEVTLPNQAVYF